MELEKNVLFEREEEALKVKIKIYTIDRDPDNQIYVYWKDPRVEKKIICKHKTDLISTLEELETRYEVIWNLHPGRKLDYIEPIVRFARNDVIAGLFDPWIVKDREEATFEKKE